MSAHVESEPIGSKDPIGMRIVLAIAGVLVLTTVSLTFGQVILRTVFNNPQAWAEEVSRYVFAWIVFLGAAIAFGRDTHIRIDFLDTMVGSAGLKLLRRVRTVIVLCAAGVMVYSGSLVAWRNRNSTFYTLPWFPQVVFYAVIPLCGLLTLAFVFWRVGRPTQSGASSPTKVG